MTICPVRMLRRCGAVLVLSLVSLSRGDAQSNRLRVALPAYERQILMDTLAEAIHVPEAAPGKVFHAADIVLRNVLRTRPDVRDSLLGMVAVARFVKTRNLGGTPLSKYLNCGSGMTGLFADNYRVQMPVAAFVDPSPKGGSMLRVAVIAAAQDPSGTSNTAVTCGSTGVLEAELRRAIQSQLTQLP